MKDKTSFDYYIEAMERYPLLSKEENETLLKQAHSGNKEARDKLVNHNQRLVYSIAKTKLRDRIDIMDIIQAGNIGLMYAIDNYDETRSAFSTFATLCINQYIGKYYDNECDLVRKPQWAKETLRKIVIYSDRYYMNNHEYPTDEDIAETLGMSVNMVQLAKTASNTSTISIDTPINDKGETFSDMIADETTIAVKSTQMNMKNAVNIALDTLTDEDRIFMEDRFGLNGKTAKTLQELGDERNMTREAARQKEKIILAKLRYPDTLKGIRQQL